MCFEQLYSCTVHFSITRFIVGEGAGAADRNMSAGKLFRQAVATHNPLQVLGAVNPYSGRLAQLAGAKALYVSGSGVATASHGLPDLGITTMHDVVHDVAALSSCSSLPILVDIDTGFGGAFNIARTIRELERAGAGAVHIEDQVVAKRCGHRPGKQLVSTAEMVDRIKTAVDAKRNPDFVIMARTDAIASEGLDSALERCDAYIDAGAEMLFPGTSEYEEESCLYSIIIVALKYRGMYNPGNVSTNS